MILTDLSVESGAHHDTARFTRSDVGSLKRVKTNGSADALRGKPEMTHFRGWSGAELKLVTQICNSKKKTLPRGSTFHCRQRSVAELSLIQCEGTLHFGSIPPHFLKSQQS